MPILLIPIGADIRTGLISIMSNNLGVIEFALQNSFSLGGTRFREWEPFAPLIDFGVLLDVDPVVELDGEAPEDLVEDTYRAQIARPGSDHDSRSDVNFDAAKRYVAAAWLVEFQDHLGARREYLLQRHTRVDIVLGHFFRCVDVAELDCDAAVASRGACPPDIGLAMPGC